MNKRARMRLIGVTAIILIVVAVLVITVGNKQGAISSKVADITSGKTAAGSRVQVEGTVVSGSWNKQSNPMKFSIKDEQDNSANPAVVKVVYTGGAPDTFGDGVTAIVTGTLGSGNVVTANQMVTKCPSKYESATGAIPVAELGAGKSMVGQSNIQITGFVKPGSLGPASAAIRFIVAASRDGSGKSVNVKFAGALPETVKDGVQVVVTGTLTTNDEFDATSVALSK